LEQSWVLVQKHVRSDQPCGTVLDLELDDVGDDLFLELRVFEVLGRERVVVCKWELPPWILTPHFSLKEESEWIDQEWGATGFSGLREERLLHSNLSIDYETVDHRPQLSDL
jgi:hypothetical protein